MSQSARNSPAKYFAPPSDDIPEAADLCSWSITTLVSAAGRITVLWVVGEVDLFTLPILRAALVDSRRRRHDCLIVDLSHVTFCGAAGLTLLELAGGTAAERDVGYVISGCPPALTHIWSLLRDAAPPVRYATAADAATAVWTDRVAASTLGGGFVGGGENSLGKALVDDLAGDRAES